MNNSDKFFCYQMFGLLLFALSFILIIVIFGSLMQRLLLSFALIITGFCGIVWYKIIFLGIKKWLDKNEKRFYRTCKCDKCGDVHNVLREDTK